MADEIDKGILESDLEKAEALNKSMAQMRKMMEDIKTSILESIRANNELGDKSNAALEKEITQRRLILESLESAEKRALRGIENAKNEVEIIEKQLEYEKVILEQYEERKRQGEDINQSLEEQKDKLEKITEELKKTRKEFEEANKQAQQFTGSLKTLASGDIIGGLKGIGKAFTDKIGSKAMGRIEKDVGSLFQTLGKGGSAAAGAAAALGALGAAALSLGIVAFVTKGIVELVMEIENSTTQFMKATGASRDFASSIIPLTAELRKFGMSAKEASESMMVLFGSVSDFSMMSVGAREEMTKNAAVLNRLGVSNQDFATGSQVAIKAMGQTGIQAAATQREIAALGMDIGVAPAKMASDFASAGPKLAKFGSDGVRAFKDLAVAAKVTGIAIDRLLSITDKFDTFEGAATQAGKLNAALGGNFVNAMELVTATDPVERMKMIRNSIIDAGLSFNEMSYYQRKFYAESAGLQDEAELAALMSGNFDSLAGNIGKTSEQYADMAEKSKQVQSLQEKFNTVMMQLIPVVEPLVDILVSMSEWMMNNLETVQTGFKVMAYGAGALAVALGAIALATSPVWIGIGAILSGLTLLAGLLFVENFASSFLEGLFKISGGFESIGSAALAAASPITGLMKAGDALADAFFGEDGVKVGAEMTTKSVQKMDMATASAASTSRAAAPTIATTSAVTNAVNNSTTNNYGGGESNVNIKFDNKKFADLFDVQVEKSIGRAARRAVV